MLGNSKEIAKLQERITALEAELATANGNSTKLQADLDKARAQLLKAQASANVVTRLRAALANTRAKLAALAGGDVKVAKGKVKKAKAEAGDGEEDPEEKDKEGEDGEADDSEEDEDTGETDARACAELAEKLTSKASVDTQVTERLAAAGVDPVRRDPQAKDSTGTGKPQADSSLTPRQRSVNALNQMGVFAKK